MAGNTVILCLPNGNKIIVDIPNLVAKEEIPNEDDNYVLFESSKTTDNAIDDMQMVPVENIKNECGYLSSINSPDISDFESDSNSVSPLKIEKTEIGDSYYDKSDKDFSFSENESCETRDLHCIPDSDDEREENGLHDIVSGLIQMLDNQREEEIDPCHDKTDAVRITDFNKQYIKTYKSNLTGKNNANSLESDILVKTRSTEIYEGLNKYHIEWTNEDGDKSPENDDRANMKIVEVRTLVNDTDSSSDDDTTYRQDDFEKERDCDTDTSFKEISHPLVLSVDTKGNDIELGNAFGDEPVEPKAFVSSPPSLLKMAIRKINGFLENSMHDENLLSDESSSSFDFYLSDSSELSWAEETQGESSFEYDTNTCIDNVNLEYRSNMKTEEINNRSIEPSCANSIKNKPISSYTSNANLPHNNCSLHSEGRRILSVSTKIVQELVRDLSKQSCDNMRIIKSVDDEISSKNTSGNWNSGDETLNKSKLMTLIELSLSAINVALLKKVISADTNAFFYSQKATTSPQISENYSCLPNNCQENADNADLTVSNYLTENQNKKYPLKNTEDIYEHCSTTKPKAKQPDTLRDISISYINSVIKRETKKSNAGSLTFLVKTQEQGYDVIYKPCFSTVVKIKSITGNCTLSKFKPNVDNTECSMVNHQTSNIFSNHPNTIYGESDNDSSDIRFEIPTIGREIATNNIFAPSANMKFPLTQITYEDWGLINPRIRDNQDQDRKLKWADITNMIRNENKKYFEKDENDVEVVSDSERSDSDLSTDTHRHLKRNTKIRFIRGRFIEIKLKKRRGRRKRTEEQPRLQHKLKYRRRRGCLTNNSNTVYRCPSCNYSTKKPSLLKGHQQFHYNKSIQCIYCAYKTNALVNLREHAALFHGTSNIYKCENCAYYCSNANDLYLHQGLHKIKIVVPKLVPKDIRTPGLSVENSAGFKSFTKLYERENEPRNMLPSFDYDLTIDNLSIPEETVHVQDYFQAIQSTPFPFEEDTKIVDTNNKRSKIATSTKAYSKEGYLHNKIKSIQTLPEAVPGFLETNRFRKKRRKRRTKKIHVKSKRSKVTSTNTRSGKSTLIQATTSMKTNEIDLLIKNVEKSLDLNKSNTDLELPPESLNILEYVKEIRPDNIVNTSQTSIHGVQEDMGENEYLDSQSQSLNRLAADKETSQDKIIEIRRALSVHGAQGHMRDNVYLTSQSQQLGSSPADAAIKQHQGKIMKTGKTLSVHHALQGIRDDPQFLRKQDINNSTTNATQQKERISHLKKKSGNITIEQLNDNSDENIKYMCLTCKHGLKDIHSLFGHIAKNHILYKFSMNDLSGPLAVCIKSCKLNHSYLCPIHNHFSHVYEISPPYTMKTLGDGHNNSLLVKKMTIGTSENYHSCPRCPLWSKDLEMLVQHMLEEHLSNSKLCLACGISLGDETLLYEHALKLHRQALVPKQTLELKRGPLRKITCPFCVFETFSQHNMIEHFLLTHPTKLMRCILCNFLAFSKNNLDAHATKTHMHFIFPKSMDDSESFNDDFRKLEKVLRSGSTHIEPFPLLVMILSTVRATDRDRTTLRTLYYKVLDKFCSDGFDLEKKPSNLTMNSPKENYLKKLKDLFYDPLMAFFCPECSFKSKNDQEFVLHVFKSHGSITIRKCVSCSFETKKNYYYYWHYWEKHAESILKCDKCYYWTFKQSHLLDHSTRHQAFDNLNQDAFISFSNIKRKHLTHLTERLSDHSELLRLLHNGTIPESETESADSDGAVSSSSNQELCADDETENGRPANSALMDHNYATRCKDPPDDLNASNRDNNQDMIPNNPDAVTLVKDICDKEAKIVLTRVITCQLCNFYTFDSIKFLDHILLVHREAPKITWEKLQDKPESAQNIKIYSSDYFTNSDHNTKTFGEKKHSISAQETSVKTRNEKEIKTVPSDKTRSLLRKTEEKTELKIDQCLTEHSRERPASPELERLMSDLIIALNNDVIIAQDDHSQLLAAQDSANMKNLESYDSVSNIVSNDISYSVLKENLSDTNGSTECVETNPLHITKDEDYLGREQKFQNISIVSNETVKMSPFECEKDCLLVASNVFDKPINPMPRTDQLSIPDIEIRKISRSNVKPKQNTNSPSEVKKSEIFLVPDDEEIDYKHSEEKNHNDYVYILPSDIINDGIILDPQVFTPEPETVETSVQVISEPMTEYIYFQNTSKILKNTRSPGRMLKNKKQSFFPINDNGVTKKQIVNKHVKISLCKTLETINTNTNETYIESSKGKGPLKLNVYDEHNLACKFRTKYKIHKNNTQPIRCDSHDPVCNESASTSTCIDKTTNIFTENKRNPKVSSNDLNKLKNTSPVEMDPQQNIKRHSKPESNPSYIENASSKVSSHISTIKNDKIVAIQKNPIKDQSQRFLISGLNDETIAVLDSKLKVVEYDDFSDDDYDCNVSKSHHIPHPQKPWVERTITPTKKSYQIKNKNGEITSELNGKDTTFQIRNAGVLLTKKYTEKVGESDLSPETAFKKCDMNSSDYFISKHKQGVLNDNKTIEKPETTDVLSSIKSRFPELKVKILDNKKIDLSKKNAVIKSLSSKPLSKTVVSGNAQAISIQVPLRSDKNCSTAISTQKTINDRIQSKQQSHESHEVEAKNSIQSKHQSQEVEAKNSLQSTQLSHEIEAKNGVQSKQQSREEEVQNAISNLSGRVSAANNTIDSRKVAMPDNINQSEDKLRRTQKCDYCNSTLLKKIFNNKSPIQNEYLWCPYCKILKKTEIKNNDDLSKRQQLITKTNANETLIQNTQSSNKIKTHCISSIANQLKTDFNSSKSIFSTTYLKLNKSEDFSVKENCRTDAQKSNAIVSNGKNIESCNPKLENIESQQPMPILSPESSPDESNILPSTNSNTYPQSHCDIPLSSPNISIDKKLNIHHCNNEVLLGNFITESVDTLSKTKRDSVDMEKSNKTSDCNLQEISPDSGCDSAPLVPKTSKRVKPVKEKQCIMNEKFKCENDTELIIEGHKQIDNALNKGPITIKTGSVATNSLCIKEFSEEIRCQNNRHNSTLSECNLNVNVPTEKKSPINRKRKLKIKSNNAEKKRLRSKNKTNGEQLKKSKVPSDNIRKLSLRKINSKRGNKSLSNKKVCDLTSTHLNYLIESSKATNSLILDKSHDRFEEVPTNNVEPEVSSVRTKRLCTKVLNTYTYKRKYTRRETSIRNSNRPMQLGTVFDNKSSNLKNFNSPKSENKLFCITHVEQLESGLPTIRKVFVRRKFKVNRKLDSNLKETLDTSISKKSVSLKSKANKKSHENVKVLRKECSGNRKRPKNPGTVRHLQIDSDITFKISKTNTETLKIPELELEQDIVKPNVSNLNEGTLIKTTKRSSNQLKSESGKEKHRKWPLNKIICKKKEKNIEKVSTPVIERTFCPLKGMQNEEILSENYKMNDVNGIKKHNIDDLQTAGLSEWEKRNEAENDFNDSFCEDGLGDVLKDSIKSAIIALNNELHCHIDTNNENIDKSYNSNLGSSTYFSSVSINSTPQSESCLYNLSTEIAASTHSIHNSTEFAELLDFG